MIERKNVNYSVTNCNSCADPEYFFGGEGLGKCLSDTGVRWTLTFSKGGGGPRPIYYMSVNLNFPIRGVSDPQPPLNPRMQRRS